MPETFRQTVEEVLADLESSAESGLSHGEVQRRRRRYGRNRLEAIASRSAWGILVDQFKSVVVILLLAAAGAAALFGRLVEALAIAAAVLVNTAIGFGMELHATRAMEALQRLGKTKTRVRRGGRDREVDTEALVPGDIVLLEAGDLIPADLRLLEANRLQIDEAALTGESVAVDKQTDALSGEDDISLGDRRNMAYKGTAVTQGSGSGVVVAIGMSTELGHISSLVESAKGMATPLEKRLDALGRRLVWLTLAIAVVVAAAGAVAGKDLLVMLETAIALAIAAVPEGLPVVATLALAQGMRQMARRHAVVKRLSAVETLGAASLIFTDKTGTLTDNHMTLARLALDRGRLEVDREDGTDFREGEQRLDPTEVRELRTALEIGVLCNNASLEGGAAGDPTEVSLLEAGAAAGVKRDELLDAYPEVREEGFDPDVKMMATFHREEERVRVAVKGAPEAVLPACTRVLTTDGERALDEAGRSDWKAHSDELASGGLRVLALAEKRADDAQAEPYAELTLVALAGLYDPPRAGIQDTIAACQSAGIRIVMGTGDHAATARAIAREIGLAGEDEIPVEADQLKDLGSLDEEERRDLLGRSVFPRISPEQKLDLIRLYQEEGWIVGMTGDGVNDAPGLKQADIGIAMGKRGTEVARESADMVLTDDAFATIVAAVKQGRTIFDNIRRFIVYLLSGNLGEIMAVSAAALVAAPLPLLPLQILYINFISDVLPALALGLSPSEPGVMRRPPRDAGEPIVPRRLWVAIAGYGAVIAAAVLAAFATALLVLRLPTAEAVTIGFLTFGLARLWHVFNMRGSDSPLIRNEITANPHVWTAITVGVALLLAAAYVPLFAEVLSVHPPDAQGWLLCLAFSLLPLIAVQVMKLMGLWWEAPPE